MAQNNDGPGKRLKREQAKNTLYVDNPNDARLKSYQDSLSLYKEGLYPFVHFYDYGSGQDLQPKENYVPQKNVIFGKENIKKADITKDIQGIKEELKWQENSNVRKNLGDRLGLLNKSLKTGIYPTNMEYPDTYTARLIYKKPERPVVLVKRPKADVIEPLSPRQSPAPTFTPEEIVTPVMRPVPMEEPIIEKPIETEKREVFYRNNKGQRKLPKAVMPTRQGGWGNQPLLMQLFPRLYQK